jgi:hypothetical protein
MKLTLSEEDFRRIKPPHSNDNWCAGEDCHGNNAMSSVEKGKLYRNQIIELLENINVVTINCISEELDIGKKVVASIVQKMYKNGTLKKEGKIIGSTGRKSTGYKLGKKEFNN